MSTTSRDPSRPAVPIRAATVRTTAIYASVVLWVATIAGNVVLFSVRPATHWPLLEGLETLQVISLIPIALILHSVNRRSALSLAITCLGPARFSTSISFAVVATRRESRI